ncbi:hypothetical protein COY87_00700 [Candidatus Roizmanbacteria bacterium CG_4_10_14_0_8_um_filter_33_9]|uniref:Glycosyltransferase RgtA/B/C/D-like domain-containing protein n=1 Tax=Candidatus Roizmanbacteria bacterium CG_4_10_14_0_8_um_filter_33_9 TaxID=1974826 RepID=A0A2M7QKV5_9BACT|nr:MAG: hypothetical protein COY87_00700 [Candidatus Roizmanbacteria bacterium CG_4_10_14_0_8_um_filter_33_9]
MFTLILIPLSSYIVFDANHSMLQATSLLRFITQKGSYSHFVNILIDRIFGFFSYSIQLFSYYPVNEKTSSVLCTIFNFLISCFFILFIFKQRSHRKRINQNMLYLSIYFYFGFWFLTLFTSQTIHWYYYFPFLTVTIICFAILITKFSHYVLYPVILLIVSFNMIQGLKSFQYSDINSSSWEFHYNLAKHIFKDAPKQFGYYINTFDQISSYLPMYAMKYSQQQFAQTRSHSLEKKPITYLIIGSYPDNKPLDNNWWKKERVRITKKPLEKIVYKNGFVVEKYFLNDAELKTPADTTIFQTLQYR